MTSLSVAAIGQCSPGNWVGLGGLPCPFGAVYAMVAWDPDGAGPLPEHYVCGGDFEYAGTSACANIALYDPVARTWSAIGGGFDGTVFALLVTSGNELIAGGTFWASGGTALQGIARLTVNGWQTIGSGVSGSVAALAELPSGDLVAGGEFVGGGHIALWDGQSWNGLGAGVTALPGPLPPGVQPVTDIVVRNNELVVHGAFSLAGGIVADGVARWDGAAWSAIGLPTGDAVIGLSGTANGDVLLRAVTASGPVVRRWDGAAFTTLGTSPESFSVLFETAAGTIVGGALDTFSNTGVAYEWTGSAWQPFPSNGSTPSFGQPQAIVESSPGELLVASWTPQTSVVALRNGVVESLAPGLDGRVTTVIADGDRFVAAGYFSQIGAASARGIAAFDGNAWQPVGTGFEYVLDVIRDDAGRLVAAGVFTDPSGVTGSAIARFDGVQWQPLPLPQVQPPFFAVDIEQAANGDLLAVSSGNVRVARSNGSSWSLLAAPVPLFTDVSDLVELPNGDLVLAGNGFGALVQRWRGGVWTPLVNGPSGALWGSVSDLHVEPDGDLLCGGVFTLGTSSFSYPLARWDGASWSAEATPSPFDVVDIDALPNGDLVITQRVDPLTTTPMVLSGASAIAPGLSLTVTETVHASAINEAGQLLTTGVFATGAGAVTGGVALYTTACQASVFPAGTGCSSSAGPLDLAIERRAWLGGTFTSRTTGMPATSVAVSVFGLSTVSLPLSSVLPQALPGCTLHVSPDVLWLALPQGGEALTDWTLPSAAALLSQAFLHQVVAAELGGAGAITEISSSNAFQLTIGGW